MKANNKYFMLSECCMCRAIAPKEKVDEEWSTGEYIERGEIGYDFLRYINGNNKVTHGYCNPCFEITIDTIEEMKRKNKE